MPQYVTNWSFSLHLLLFNTRGLCRLLRHCLPHSSQLCMNRTSREVDRDWSVVFRRTFARKWESVHALRTIQAIWYPRVSTFNFIFIYTYLHGVLIKYELSTIFNIYGIYQCIFSPDNYVYLIFRSVSANNINWVFFTFCQATILKVRFFPHAYGRGSTIGCCESCHPWW